MTAKPVADKVEAVAVELRLGRISRLYNSLDPGPFPERDLDAAVEESIVDRQPAPAAGASGKIDVEVRPIK
jgi:hypothetical protein